MAGETRREYRAYKQALLDRFGDYREKRYAEQDHLFDPDPRRYHVFRPEYADRNVFSPDLAQLIERGRHRWLADMGSSQALALSVFGTLLNRGGLALFGEATDEQGRPLLLDIVLEGRPEFEYPVRTLRESPPTRVDLFLPWAQGHVAIECQLWEVEFGPCSQVDAGQCGGSYALQAGHEQRCALSGKGIRYWRYIPELFRWRADADHIPCPIWKAYQLVRSVLAAAVDPREQQVWGYPVAVLVYDERNPFFAPGGEVDEQFRAVQAALQGPATLKRVTWQAATAAMAKRGGYADLLTWLDDKYGIAP